MKAELLSSMNDLKVGKQVVQNEKYSDFFSSAGVQVVRENSYSIFFVF
jgi:hypothetical protein